MLSVLLFGTLANIAYLVSKINYPTHQPVAVAAVCSESVVLMALLEMFVLF